MTKFFEVVVFTASMSSYACQVVDKLDLQEYGFLKLYREHCSYHKDTNFYIKDLSKLGRDLKDVIILDNIPASYCLQPRNGIPIKSWLGDPNDTELKKYTPLLEKLSKVTDVRKYIQEIVEKNTNKIQFNKCGIMNRKNDEEEGPSPLNDVGELFEKGIGFLKKLFGGRSNSEEGSE